MKTQSLMNSIKLFIPALVLIYSIGLSSQAIGIGANVFTPDASAMLEVQATNKGILIPRVALTQTSSASPVTTPATSLLVYNTASVNDVTPGYYYWNGTKWIRLLESDKAWLLTGNAGTNPATHFIGTTDNQHLVFRTNNVERMRITNGGFVGIGTSTPNQMLDVNGNLQFSGALMPNGNARLAGAFLRSQGPGLPPVWSPPGLTLVGIYTRESTANLCINSTTFTTYPGCSQTLALTAGQRVVAFAEAGIMVDNNCDGIIDVGYVFVDARIAVNGNDFPNGAWLRTSLDYDVAYSGFNSITLIGEYTVPANGNYTFELQARKSGGNGNALSGGDNTSALQATLILIVYNP